MLIQKSKKRPFTLHYVLLSMWAVIVILPIWTMIINSFKTKYDIYQAPFSLPQKWVFENYRSVLQSGDFLIYFKNSILVTVISIFFIILFGAMAAYALVNRKNKLTVFLYFFFIVFGIKLFIQGFKP